MPVTDFGMTRLSLERLPNIVPFWIGSNGLRESTQLGTEYNAGDNASSASGQQAQSIDAAVTVGMLSLV